VVVLAFPAQVVQVALVPEVGLAELGLEGLDLANEGSFPHRLG